MAVSGGLRQLLAFTATATLILRASADIVYQLPNGICTYVTVPGKSTYRCDGSCYDGTESLSPGLCATPQTSATIRSTHPDAHTYASLEQRQRKHRRCRYWAMLQAKPMQLDADPRHIQLLRLPVGISGCRIGLFPEGPAE
jgi:hypothetical protein